MSIDPLFAVYRRRFALYVFVGMFLFIAWGLSPLGLLPPPGIARAPIWIKLVLGCLAAIGPYCFWIAGRCTPILAVYEDRIEIEQYMMPWRRCAIPLAKINEVVADDPPESAFQIDRCELRVSFIADPITDGHSRMVRLFMTGATHTPLEAAEAIVRQLQLMKAQARDG